MINSTPNTNYVQQSLWLLHFMSSSNGTTGHSHNQKEKWSKRVSPYTLHSQDTECTIKINPDATLISNNDHSSYHAGVGWRSFSIETFNELWSQIMIIYRHPRLRLTNLCLRSVSICMICAKFGRLRASACQHWFINLTRNGPSGQSWISDDSTSGLLLFNTNFCISE